MSSFRQFVLRTSNFALVSYFLLVLTSLQASADLRLIEAVKEGNQEAVRALLSASTDVNASGVDGATALAWAAHRDDLETVELLIGAGANPDVANQYGVTPLALACINRNDLMIERLLEAGANPNAARSTGETVLMTCSRAGSLGGVRALLSREANVNEREVKKGQTALMWAAAGKHWQVTRALVEYGADVNASTKIGFTPLFFAARSGDLESARTLVEKSANLNVTTSEHGSALTLASASGQEALSIFLLKRGADPDVADGNGISPLHWAAQRGLSILDGVRYDDSYNLRPENMPNLARALVAHGADPNLQIKQRIRLGPDEIALSIVGATPLFLAAVAADAEIMQILADAGADPSLAAEGNNTPLMVAAGAARASKRRDPEEDKRAQAAVRVAVGLGADIHAKNDLGETALHAAAFTGSDSIVRFLAEQGAEIDVSDRSGQTPWSKAAGISPVLRYRGLYENHQSTADLLLELGARPRTREQMDTLSNASRRLRERN